MENRTVKESRKNNRDEGNEVPFNVQRSAFSGMGTSAQRGSKSRVSMASDPSSVRFLQTAVP